jgi:cathepsin H
MLRIILVSALLLAAVSCFNFNLDAFAQQNVQEHDIELLFEMYLQHLAPSHVTYSAERYLQFKEDIHDIIAHNSNPESTWKRTINQFTGMTFKELEGSAIMVGQNCSATNGVSALGLTNVPTSHDWREKGIVSPVKNQGHCGSCWTFSTTGAVESHWALHKKTTPPDLSEQQLVDCAGDFNNHGCSGGLPSQAFEYIKWAGGIEGERNYPYKGVDDTCHFQKKDVDARLPFGSVNITEADETALLEAAFTAGPVSVAFQVTKDFSSYKGGVYVGTTCKSGPETVNHAVLAVGFGHDATTNLDYWIVKNSWSAAWGEEGYFRIKRGVNMCGIAVCASYPHIKKNDMGMEQF